MILPRYVLKELAVPLAVWVGFLFLLLIVMQFLRGTDVLLGSGVRATDLALLCMYLTPHFLVMALPVALLLAILLGLGRLSEDREVIALQAVGVGPCQLLRVPLALSVAVSGLMLLLTWSLEPWGLASLQGVVNTVIKRNVMGDVRPGVFKEDLTGFTVYAEGVDPKTHVWRNVLIHDDQDPAAPVLVLARKAWADADVPGVDMKLLLEEGQAHRATSSREEYNVVRFDRGELAVWLGDTLWRGNHFSSPNEEMTPGELSRAAEALGAQGQDPTALRMAYHTRLGRTFTPMAFACLAAPLALSGSRGRRARGLAVTLLAYVGYYVLARAFETLGVQGRLPLAVAAQLPNALFGLVGLILLARLGRTGEQG